MGDATRQQFKIAEVGIQTPAIMPLQELRCGQVGYIAAAVKSVADLRPGDLLLDAASAAAKGPAGGKRKQVKSMLYSSVYPIDSGEFDGLRKAIDRLTLNDPSVHAEAESSGALGQGYRCGFLGKLHMEVFYQRLADEYETQVISTAPMVPIDAVMSVGKEPMLRVYK